MKDQEYAENQLKRLRALRRDIEGFRREVPDHALLWYCIGGIWAYMEMLEKDGRLSLADQLKESLKVSGADLSYIMQVDKED